MAWVLTAGKTMPLGARADAFEALYLANYRQVHAVAKRVGLDASEAEDVAQEAFAQFHRRHPADAPYAVAWIRRAAAHLALNALRTRQRREAREEREARTSGEAAASSAADPHAMIESAERRRAVRLAMGRLSQRHGTVLALRYSGMSYAEVAAAAGIPVSHIGSVLRRAESAFKKEFENASRG